MCSAEKRTSPIPLHKFLFRINSRVGLNMSVCLLLQTSLVFNQTGYLRALLKVLHMNKMPRKADYNIIWLLEKQYFAHLYSP